MYQIRQTNWEVIAGVYMFCHILFIAMCVCCSFERMIPVFFNRFGTGRAIFGEICILPLGFCAYDKLVKWNYWNHIQVKGQNCAPCLLRIQTTFWKLAQYSKHTALLVHIHAFYPGLAIVYI